MTKRAWSLIAIALLAIGAAVIYLSGPSDRAPASTFVLLDGSKKTTGDLRGQVTLVNFWATSCASCVAEMPEMVATHQKYQSRGYQTLAVAMSYDPPAYVVNFSQSRQLPFKVAIDNGVVEDVSFDIQAKIDIEDVATADGEFQMSYSESTGDFQLHAKVALTTAAGFNIGTADKPATLDIEPACAAFEGTVQIGTVFQATLQGTFVYKDGCTRTVRTATTTDQPLAPVVPSASVEGLGRRFV